MAEREPPESTKAAARAPDLTPDHQGNVHPGAVHAYLANKIRGSALEGAVPRDAAQFGLSTRKEDWTAERWSGFIAGYLKSKESNLNIRSLGDHGTSKGLFQLSRGDPANYDHLKLNQGTSHPFTDAQLRDPKTNLDAGLAIWTDRFKRSGNLLSRPGVAEYWGPLRHRGGAHFARIAPDNNAPTSPVAPNVADARPSQSGGPAPAEAARDAARNRGDDSGAGHSHASHGSPALADGRGLQPYGLDPSPVADVPDSAMGLTGGSGDIGPVAASALVIRVKAFFVPA
jgi:hypothetical protein